MSEQSVHYEKLGLTEASSFEEVQSAKKRLAADYEDDPKKKESIEAAYDAILMERLRLRQEGKIKVPDRIRFAEKQAKLKASSPVSNLTENIGTQWFSDFLDQPESSSELLWPSVLFGGLIILSWLLRSESAVGASFALALGMMGAVYFLNQKTRKFWRSSGLSAIGLVVGLCLGIVIVQMLGAQGTSLQDEQVASLSTSVTLTVLWFVTSFLR
ncbi:MAG: CPP1-like family protein [Cyanobacteria bacterium J06576_12]